MYMKRAISLLLSALLLLSFALSLTACGDDPQTTTPSTSTTPAPATTSSALTTPSVSSTPSASSTTSMQTPTPVDPNAMQTYELTASSPVKVTGRQTVLNTGLALDHSASGVEFNVTLTAPSDVNATMAAGDGIFFTVYIDGVRQDKRIQFTAMRGTTQTLAKQLSVGTHNIRLVRETENAKGAFTLASLSFKGVFAEKPQDKPYYIEFLGDSITCGTGNLHKYLEGATNPYEIMANQNGTCTDTMGDNNPTDEQSATYSYAFLAAEALGADASLICRTGIGLIGGWGSTMPDYFEFTSAIRDETITGVYIPDQKPDLVVINLGTNDVYTHDSGTYNEDFKIAVKWLIQIIRWKYNDSDLKILWTSGMMNHAKKALVQQAIDEMNDENLYTFFDYASTAGGHNGHPTYPAHQAAAELLAAYIRENILTGTN